MCIHIFMFLYCSYLFTALYHSLSLNANGSSFQEVLLNLPLLSLLFLFIIFCASSLQHHVPCWSYISLSATNELFFKCLFSLYFCFPIFPHFLSLSSTFCFPVITFHAILLCSHTSSFPHNTHMVISHLYNPPCISIMHSLALVNIYALLRIQPLSIALQFV